jgi:hypothetical protein
MSKVLYPLAAGPRPTQLVRPYTPGDESVILVDVSYLPPAPNLITISHDERFVTLKYESIVDENTVSGISYIEGDNTYVFPEMSLALRTINKYDFDAIRESIVADVSEVIGHIDDYDNPHRVSKTQIGLGDVDNTSDVDKPISSATQTALNNINNSLESHVDNKSNPHGVTKSQVGLSNVDNTSDLSKPISTATQTALNNKADLVGGKVPIEQLPESSSLQLGTGPDDAYYGDKGNVAYIHSQTTSGNPHHVTKSDVGLGDVDNTSDANKPVSTAQATAIGAVQTNLDDHESDTSNPHAVTKAQVGLGDVDNTSDLNKPISSATQIALNGKADLIDGKVPSNQLPEGSTLELGITATTAYYGDKGKIAYDHSQLKAGNPHDVTKSDVGLSNVDNTSDADKPVSTAMQTALSTKADLVDGKVPSAQLPEAVVGLELGTTATTAYYGDKGKVAYDHSQLVSGNPHHVNKSDVGLSNVDNTSDVNKPVSTAQQTAISGVQDNLDNHIEDTSNPHQVTKSQVGLGNVDNTSDSNKPVSTLQKAAIDTVQSNLDTHEADISNPHSVTKTQVGLGNVDNTSDADKPVSTAQQNAISGVQSNLTTHVEDVSNPHSVTKSQVGLGNVDDTSDADKPISTATQTALDGKADLVEGKVPSSQLPDNIGLELGITATTAYYGDKGKIAYDHSQLTSGNPHNVTKSEVGLGNVDNTSDSNKPVSTLQATAIGLVQTNLTNHEDDKSNPHEVDKSQVGLGNVDNTSDLNKPISTAVQAALDTKMTGTYSGVTPNPPTINGSSGSLNTVSRGDHTHPSETFTITDITVLSGDWVGDSTYIDFPYKATISNANVTSNHTPFVVFSQESVSLGIYAQVADTSNGTISIYASEIPSSSTVVKTIVLIRRIE